MYAVKDVKISAFLKPFPAEHDGLAERSFDNAVEDPQSPLSEFPEDFQLWKISIFNDETGNFDKIEHVLITDAMSCKLRHTRRDQLKEVKNG